MRLKILQLLLVCTVCFGSLKSEIDAIISKPSVSKATFGVKVLDADNGKVLYSRNSTKALMPASNMKLITTAAAIEILGADYEFVTSVYYKDGNLIVKGSGDPLTGDKSTLAKNNHRFGWEFEQIIGGLKAAGIDSVDDIIVDSSVFDDKLVHPSWPTEQLNRHYAPEVCGINYNGNCIEVVAFPSGSNVAFTKEPDTSYVNITNRASINSKRTNTVWISRLGGSNNMTLYGKCFQRSVPILVTIHRPAVYFGYLLAEEMMSKGFGVQGSIVEAHIEIDTKLKNIANFKTPLKDVVSRSNCDSFNLAAECLAKKISAAGTKGHIGGQWSHAGEIVEQYLKSLSLNTSDFVYDDGCGLSRENRVSAELIADLLLHIYNSPQKQYFIDTLAVGGVKGSSPVRRYFTDDKYKGKIYAKSGSISGVQAMSGYCNTEKGVIIFSILINNTNGSTRTALNNIIKAIFD